MPREPFIVRLGRLGEALQRIREILEPGRAFRRAEAGRALDRVVPGGRPDAVGFAPARRPGQHRGVEGDPAGRAERGQRAARVGEHLGALEHRRGAAEPVGGAVEQRELGGQADLAKREVPALARIGGEHRRRRPDQKGVDEAVGPVEPEGVEHVMGHVLLVPDRPPARRGTGERGGDGAPVGRLRGDHLGAQGMVEAGRLEIGGVEGLVADRAIGAGAEGAHHRGRNVARARPHRDADGRGHRARTTGHQNPKTPIIHLHCAISNISSLLQ